MTRMVALAMLLVGGGVALAQEPVKVDVTVRKAPLVDWGAFVNPPVSTAKGHAAIGDALDEARASRDRQRLIELETQRLAVARAQAATPRPAPAAAEVDPQLAMVSSWRSAGDVVMPAGFAATAKVDANSVRPLGASRLFRWGIVSGARANSATGLMDCTAKTLEPRWPESGSVAVVPGSAWWILYQAVCPALK